MPLRVETFVDGFDQWAGPWEKVLNGTPVPPLNQPYGNWGNQPGGSVIGGYFQNHDRRLVVKIGMQWQAGFNNTPYDGTGLVLQFLRTSGSDAYAPIGVALDCKEMGFIADGVYREYVLPTPFPARGISWVKGFDDSRIPFNGVFQKLRVVTDDWTPSSAPQGTVRTAAATGSGMAPQVGGPGAWHIQTEAGVIVATSENGTTKHGWEVGWNGSAFVLKRPLSADPNLNYQVLFRE